MSDYREHHLTVERTARYWTLGGPSDAAGARAAQDAAEPDATHAPGPLDEVWFVLHGYKQLARRFLRRFEPIADHRRLVVAPEGLSRFYVSSGGGRHGAESVVGASWMTREERQEEIGDYVRYLDRLARHVGVGDAASGGTPEGGAEGARGGVTAGGVRGSATAGLTVLGFSQGVATAARWVTRGSVRPDRLVLWGDFLPPDLDMERAEEALDGVDVVLVRGREDRALSTDLAEQEAERLAGTKIRFRTVWYDGGHDIDAPTLEALAGRS